MFKVKIQVPGDITIGPTRPSDAEAAAAAIELMREGYRKTSNAYCRISRVDRDDWLEVLAKERRISVAQFYMADGSGIDPHWEDYYIRTHSKDKKTVHPKVLQYMKSAG